MSSEAVDSKFIGSIEKILDLSLITYIVLFLLGFGFFTSVLIQNLQNSLSLILVGTLAIFSAAVRARLPNLSTVSEIRSLFIQWGIISVLIIIFAVPLILTYPISK